MLIDFALMALAVIVGVLLTGGIFKVAGTWPGISYLRDGFNI